MGQVVEAEELEKQLYAELEGLPKTGKQFVTAIRTLLKRETRSVPVEEFPSLVLPAGAGLGLGISQKLSLAIQVVCSRDSAVSWSAEPCQLH